MRREPTLKRNVFFVQTSLFLRKMTGGRLAKQSRMFCTLSLPVFSCVWRKQVSLQIHHIA
jgi:hypothetical protein